MQFYVGRNAQATADAIWEAFQVATGDTSGDTRPKMVPFPAENNSHECMT